MWPPLLFFYRLVSIPDSCQLTKEGIIQIRGTIFVCFIKPDRILCKVRLYIFAGVMYVYVIVL